MRWWHLTSVHETTCFELEQYRFVGHRRCKGCVVSAILVRDFAPAGHIPGLIVRALKLGYEIAVLQSSRRQAGDNWARRGRRAFLWTL